MTLEQIRVAFHEGRYKVTTHARQQMIDREIYYEDLEYVFAHGKIISTTPNARPYPKVQIAGMLPNEKTLIVVVSRPHKSRNFRIVTVFFEYE